MTGYFPVKKLINSLKRKSYTLYLHGEDKQDDKKIATYKERSMRNAMLKHFFSYKRNIETLKIKLFTDYNENTMHYILDVGGKVHVFSMLRESDGVKVG